MNFVMLVAMLIVVLLHVILCAAFLDLRMLK